MVRPVINKAFVNNVPIGPTTGNGFGSRFLRGPGIYVAKRSMPERIAAAAFSTVTSASIETMFTSVAVSIRSTQAMGKIWNDYFVPQAERNFVYACISTPGVALSVPIMAGAFIFKAVCEGVINGFRDGYLTGVAHATDQSVQAVGQVWKDTGTLLRTQ